MMNNSNSTEEELIDCNGVGGILFTDQEDRKFYAEYQVNDLNVKLGDCVRIKIEEDDINQEDCAFAQVLAIYEDSNEEFFIEVRWMQKENEISPQYRKMISPQHNELIESCTLDDIAAGAVMEVIDIKGTNPCKRYISGYYVCKYMIGEHSTSLQKVAPHSMLQRGMEMSYYAYAYTTFLTSLNSNIQSDPFSQAIQRLHISVIPESLPCREGERRIVENYIRDSVLRTTATARPVYICGMPGTGKTATVLASINKLREEVKAGTLPDFSFIEINCLRLKGPTDAYTMLWRGLTGVHVAPKTAHTRLTAHFKDNYEVVGVSKSGDSSKVAPLITVCLVDEMDYLLSRNLEVLYNFYSWPQHAHSRFVLIGIANTMDLPEMMSIRLQSRTSEGIDRIIFRPYAFDQIQEILSHRLSELQLTDITDKVREIISRKAASVAGDLRAALRICQKTIEMYRDLTQQRKLLLNTNITKNTTTTINTTTSTTVTFKDFVSIVKEATESYKQNPFLAVTTRACLLDKAIILIFGKHRQQTSGTEGNLNTAAMTRDAVWERLTDLIDKIHAERILSNINTTTATSSSSIKSNSLNLYQPTYKIFEQSIERLFQQGILTKATHFKMTHGPNSILYSLHSQFNYSDIVAALNNCFLNKYCV